jgi:hypothetical protein
LFHAGEDGSARRKSKPDFAGGLTTDGHGCQTVAIKRFHPQVKEMQVSESVFIRVYPWLIFLRVEG